MIVRGVPIEIAVPIPPEVLSRPDFAWICEVASRTAPATVGGVIVLTSVHRPQVPGQRFSYHSFDPHPDGRSVPGCAIDIRSGVDLPDERGAVIAPTRAERIRICEDWRTRMKRRLGDDFDVLYGAAVDHIDHIHAEKDGRKAARTYLPTEG